MNQLLFPEGWERPLEDKDHANPEPTHLPAPPALHPHTQTSAPMLRGRPARARASAVKSDLVLLGEGAREAGDGLGTSMGPFPYHLVHIPIASASHPHHIARCLPPLPPSLPTSAPRTRAATSPPPTHVSRCASASCPPWSRSPRLGSSGKVHPAPSRRRPAHPYHTPAVRRTRPTLSCDGGRPPRGRATLLLSGRPEAYDKFRWRAGSGRGSLAAVLCVVGPQGRQIAPRLAHALPHPPMIPDADLAGLTSCPALWLSRRFVGGRSKEGCLVCSCVCVTAVEVKHVSNFVRSFPPATRRSRALVRAPHLATSASLITLERATTSYAVNRWPRAGDQRALAAGALAAAGRALRAQPARRR